MTQCKLVSCKFVITFLKEITYNANMINSFKVALRIEVNQLC